MDFSNNERDNCQDLTFAFTEAAKDRSLTAAERAAYQNESVALLALAAGETPAKSLLTSLGVEDPALRKRLEVAQRITQNTQPSLGSTRFDRAELRRLRIPADTESFAREIWSSAFRQALVDSIGGQLAGGWQCEEAGHDPTSCRTVRVAALELLADRHGLVPNAGSLTYGHAYVAALMRRLRALN